MEYDETYGYEDADYEEDFGEDEDDEEASYAEEWIGQLFNGMNSLERQIGRSLTDREIQGVIDKVAEQTDSYPDVDVAYKGYYEESGKEEPDLDSNKGRENYMAERMQDIEREKEEDEQEGNWVLEEEEAA